ncbi:hypothetical protein BH10CHL1_BH10CHL1_34270 [soil metagenome]
MNYGLATGDTDYLIIVAAGITQIGMVFGIQAAHGIGDWVKAVELICSVYTVDDMKNHVEYL